MKKMKYAALGRSLSALTAALAVTAATAAPNHLAVPALYDNVGAGTI
jgi:hypothetical protein